MNIKEKLWQTMEKAIWQNIAKGLAISFIYWLAYLAAWFNSLDQWFLPAGVRAVGLLFLPYRYWPYLFAADAAALLALRIPTAWQHGKIWAYLSPFLLAPMVALVPIAFRHKLQRIDEKPIWLPAIVASIAIWSSFCKNFINSILSGPSEPDLLEILLRYVAGDFLGILTTVLPIMVWLQVKNDNFFQNNLIRDSIFSILLTFSAYFFVFPSSIEEFQNRVLLLMCVVVLPSLGLTIKHGWIGSAIGITAVNLSVFLGFPGFNFSGAYDSISFLVQQIVIVYAIAALSLGAVISQLFDRSRKI